MHGRSRRKPNSKIDAKVLIVQTLASIVATVTAELIIKILGI